MTLAEVLGESDAAEADDAAAEALRCYERKGNEVARRRAEAALSH